MAANNDLSRYAAQRSEVCPQSLVHSRRRGPLALVAEALFPVADVEDEQKSLAIDPLVRKTRRQWRFGSIARSVLAAVGMPSEAAVANLLRAHVEKFGNDALFWVGVLQASPDAVWREDALELLKRELAASPDDVCLWQALVVSRMLPGDPTAQLDEINSALHAQWSD